MLTKLASMPIVAALVVALVVIGCVTALAITGHLDGTIALGAIMTVAGGTVGVSGAHVGGQIANQTPPAPSQPPAAAVSQPPATSGTV